MLNIKEKVMKFMEEFYVFDHVCAAMCIVEDEHYISKSCSTYFAPEFKSVRWLFDYQQKKVEAAKKELADALVLCMIGSGKIQMQELGVVLEVCNEEDVDAKDAEKYISASFDIYGAEKDSAIKYDEEGAYDRFIKEFFNTAIG